MLLMLPEAHGGENYNRRVTIQSQGKKSRRCWQQVRDGIRTMKTSWPQASVAMCCHCNLHFVSKHSLFFCFPATWFSITSQKKEKYHNNQPPVQLPGTWQCVHQGLARPGHGCFAMVKIIKSIFPPRSSWKIYKKFFISACGSCNIETCGGVMQKFIKNIFPPEGVGNIIKSIFCLYVIYFFLQHAFNKN